MVLFRGARAMLVLALLVTVAGCSSNNKGKIEGTKWSCQAGTVKGNPIPAGAVRLEFSKDGKVTYVIGPKTVTGTYSLGSGDNVTFNFDQALSDGKKKAMDKIQINGDTMTMSDPDGTTLTFNKVK